MTGKKYNRLGLKFSHPNADPIKELWKIPKNEQRTEAMGAYMYVVLPSSINKAIRIFTETELNTAVYSPK